MKKTFTFLTLLVFTSIFSQIPSYVPTNGLVGYWPFSGNANDESGNGNNGTVNGASLTSDRFGNTNNAFYFSGSGCNTRIDAQVNTSSIQTGLTISVWVLQSGNGCIAPRILEFWPSSNPNGPGHAGWGWGNGANIGLGSTTSSGFGCYSGITGVVNNIWIHIVYTNDGATGKFYKNGILTSSVNSNGNPILAGNVAFGRMNHPAYDALEGKLDDIGIWNRALTQEEITNLNNSSLPQTTCLPAYVPTNGLVGYWPFCGNANDESGNGNNGTVNGATLTADRFGITNKAYSFVGANNINCGSSSIFGLTSSNILTFNFWTKSISSNFPYIQKYQDLNASNSNYFIGSSAPSINNSIRVTANGQNSIDYNAILDQWINITVIYNGLTNSASFYLNGQFISTNNITFSNQFSNKSLIFGEKPNSLYPTPNGNLDDIGIWNRALTQAEITGLYTTLGGEQTPANNQVTVYPNPAKEQIIIDCGNLSNTSGWSFQILNTLGQEVLNGKINSQQNVVSLNSLNESGVYLVKIYDASNNLLNTKKIVLQ